MELQTLIGNGDDPNNRVRGYPFRDTHPRIRFRTDKPIEAQHRHHELAPTRVTHCESRARNSFTNRSPGSDLLSSFPYKPKELAHA